MEASDSPAPGDIEAEEEDFVPPGLGEEDFPGFPADCCPAELPDLRSHHSALADVLKLRPSLYDQVRQRSTARGVGLARCIKTGIDNRGHPMVKTIGLVAGDADCYEVFRELFDPVIAQHLTRSVPEPRDVRFPGEGLGIGQVDATGRFVVGVEIRASRCLKDYRFPPAMSRDDFAAVEGRITRALLSMPETIHGTYFPLRGSSSFPERPGGMDKGDEVVLNSRGLLFEAPDSAQRLCTGAGRFWPHGRGIFTNHKKDLCVWVNEHEHMRIMMKRPGDNLEGAYQELIGLFGGLEVALKDMCVEGEEQTAFAYNNRLGYVNTNPTNLGSALHAAVTANLPLLANTQGEVVGTQWAKWCSKQRVQVRSIDYMVPGRFELSAGDPLDPSPVLVLRRLAKVTAALIQMELCLESGHPIDDIIAQDIDMGFVVDAGPPVLVDAQREVQTLAVQGDTLTDQEAVETAAVLFDTILAAVVRDLGTPAGIDISPDTAEEVKATVPLRPVSMLTDRSRPDTGCSAWTVNASDNVSMAGQQAEEMVASLIEEEMAAAAQEDSTDAAKAATEIMAVAGQALAEDVLDLQNLLFKAQQALTQANTDGTLEKALGEVSKSKEKEKPATPAKVKAEPVLLALPEELPTSCSLDMDALRSRTCQALLRASWDGTLDKTLDDMVDPEPEVGELRERLANTLFGLADAGQLISRLGESLGCVEEADADVAEEAPADAAATAACEVPSLIEEPLEAALAGADEGSMPAPAQADAPPILPYLPVVPPIAKKMPVAGFRRGRMAHWLLQAVSERDRRIGELTALVRETEVRLVQQDQHCRQIEDLISAARTDLAHVELDIEWHRRALEGAEGRTTELMAGQRKLRDELDMRRHEVKRVELDALPAAALPGIFTARSELSTATGGTTWSSINFQSPRLQPIGAVLEPLPATQLRAEQR